MKLTYRRSRDPNLGEKVIMGPWVLLFPKSNLGSALRFLETPGIVLIMPDFFFKAVLSRVSVLSPKESDNMATLHEALEVK